MSSRLLQKEVAGGDVDHPDAAVEVLGVHVEPVGLTLGHKCQLQGCASVGTGRGDPLGQCERLRVRAVAEIDHHEHLAGVEVAHVHLLPVLESTLAAEGPQGLAGGQVAQVGGVDVGELGPSDGHGDGEHRDPGDAVGGAVDGIQDQDVLVPVVDVADLLAEHVQGNVMARDVIENGILRYLVHLGGRRAVGSHAQVLAPLLEGGDEIDRLLHCVRDGGQCLKQRIHARLSLARLLTISRANRY